MERSVFAHPGEWADAGKDGFLSLDATCPAQSTVSASFLPPARQMEINLLCVSWPQTLLPPVEL